jgi:alkylation response protein AidB-like acyl-CoA dehydrogenase
VVVERETPGFSAGKMEKYMSGHQHCMHYFDNCRVPRENVVLEEDGFRKLFSLFNVERAGNAARSLALAQMAFDIAVEHAKTRIQFGRPICEFQGIQWKFADMKMKLDAARLLIYRAVVNADEGNLSPTECALAKAFTNDVAFWVAHEALQILGGYGYSTEFPMEYILRRVRGWMIGGGTVEIMKNRIAEGIFDRHFTQRPPKPQ